MSEINPKTRLVGTLRWIARLWSTLVFALAVLQIVFPGSEAGGPVPAIDRLLLSLWVVAILALAAAWRWEAVGATIAISAMFLREITFVLVKGFWIPAFLLVWILVIPPAVLFLAAWRLDRGSRKVTNE